MTGAGKTTPSYQLSIMTKFTPPIRYEGTVIPEGISYLPFGFRHRIYVRQGDTIGIITLPQEGWDFDANPWAMHWTIRERDDND